MDNLEDTFLRWSKPPSSTEQEKTERAESVLRDAVRESEFLAGKEIRVFAQGSYAANTNVRLDSDVDVCVMCKDTFFFDLPQGRDIRDYGIVPATFTFADYKTLLHSVFLARFEEHGVTRGDKAFDIHSNTYRLDADAVPAFEYRYYYDSNSTNFVSGIAFVCDRNGRRIYDYPERTLKNGRQKHDETNRRYKKVVRILKRLRNDMQDANVTAAKGVPSFLIENLVYDVPNKYFEGVKFSDDVKSVLYYLLGNIATDQTCANWTEINQIKFLFHPSQRWSRTQAFGFIWAAIHYTGL